FHDYCMANHIIAEMIRFNPVLKNELNMPHATAFNALDNVGIGLSRGYESVWQNSYVKNVRTSIRKAETFGLTFEYYLTKDLPPKKLQWFKDLYWGAMKRNNAKEYYFFSD